MNKYIVVGAGILGASTAYYLAKSGAEVTIVDRQDKGQATDAAAGMICPWISQRRNKAWYALAKGGARIYGQLVADLAADGESDTGYSRVGAISLQTEEKKLIAMRDRALKRGDDAPEIGDVTILHERETKELFPLLTDGYQAVHISGGARVDGRAMRNALIRGAQKHGATFLNGDATLIHEGNRVTGVTINGAIMQADTVIATSGAWMNELLHPLGIAFDVVPQKGQVLHVEVPGMDTSKWPVVMPPTNQFILSFDDRIVIGSTHEDDKGFDYRTTAGGLHQILSNVMDVVPGLVESTVIETRVGFRPFTPGFLPVIGAMPGYEGLLLANGLGSSGLTTGPYVGSQLANLALGKELEIDLSQYDVSGALK
ncbi:NAD(P)/FAD-dependent oxidoreductase [Oceanobacillus bengalensis]|uniref:FAD-binding oxidoreductase n=1 Tax=Oceanobacillus bengalensis TaxID=1435466 RepID=A0A494Z7S4_9BACI|nr:FAD-dependent oxidoreductase [Oceanobacillus bengalensis]RKQ18661.1 FAD-binding oxidoreductase [Oceanobacillus bengalensis]